MPTFIKLPSGQVLAVAHIVCALPDPDNPQDRISIKLTTGNIPVFIGDDAKALLRWWIDYAVELKP